MVVGKFINAVGLVILVWIIFVYIVITISESIGGITKKLNNKTKK